MEVLPDFCVSPTYFESTLTDTRVVNQFESWERAVAALPQNVAGLNAGVAKSFADAQAELSEWEIRTRGKAVIDSYLSYTLAQRNKYVTGGTEAQRRSVGLAKGASAIQKAVDNFNELVVGLDLPSRGGVRGAVALALRWEPVHINFALLSEASFFDTFSSAVLVAPRVPTHPLAAVGVPRRFARAVERELHTIMRCEEYLDQLARETEEWRDYQAADMAAHSRARATWVVAVKVAEADEVTYSAAHVRARGAAAVFGQELHKLDIRGWGSGLQWSSDMYPADGDDDEDVDRTVDEAEYMDLLRENEEQPPGGAYGDVEV